MVRSFAVLALAVVTLTPSSAQAQTPLRTLCMSPAQNWCLSIWSFDYFTEVQGNPEEDWDDQFTHYSMTVTGFGSAFEPGDWFTLFVRTEIAAKNGLNERFHQVTGTLASSEPTVVTSRAGDEILRGSAGFLSGPSVSDLYLLEAAVPGGNCRPTESAIAPNPLLLACFEPGVSQVPVDVPEPATALLLLPGVFGVVITARRRRLPEA